MEKIYEDFLKNLLSNKDRLSSYVESLYSKSSYSNNDLNYIFGVLKNEGLISCIYADNRVWVNDVTFKGKHYFDDMEGVIMVESLRLVELIDDIDRIESLFHSAGGGMVPVYMVINDIQDFQDWLMELKLELQSIYDSTRDLYIQETILLCGTRLKGTNDKKFFSELSGRLRAIRKNINKYYPDLYNHTEKGQKAEMKKKSLIFISHSSKNKNEVELFVKLLRVINLQPQEDIFCSSLPGYDIPIDLDIFEFLRSRFEENDLHMIFIHSDDYYSSAVSLNEMGAAWVLKNKATSILLPGFSFEKMNGVINDRNISIKLDNDINEVRDKLNQLKNKLIDEFKLNKIPDIEWERERDKFIDAVNRINDSDKLVLNEEAKSILYKASKISTGEISTSIHLDTGKTIQIGNEILCQELRDRRVFMKWWSALSMCEKYGLIEKKSEDLYVITGAGYEIIESDWTVQVI